MRTNGFILIALVSAATALAGSAGYLPSVGPVALRFEKPTAAQPMAVLPAPITIPEPASEAATPVAVVADIPAEIPTNSAANSGGLMHDLPVVLPQAWPGATTNAFPSLVSPMMDTNSMITPQMLLRFFTAPQGGVSRETVIIPPPGFTPARPPTSSSTATYTQPKP